LSLTLGRKANSNAKHLVGCLLDDGGSNKLGNEHAHFAFCCCVHLDYDQKKRNEMMGVACSFWSASDWY
jgi:hypothetical protein